MTILLVLLLTPAIAQTCSIKTGEECSRTAPYSCNCHTYTRYWSCPSTECRDIPYTCYDRRCDFSVTRRFCTHYTSFPVRRCFWIFCWTSRIRICTRYTTRTDCLFYRYYRYTCWRRELRILNLLVQRSS